MGSSNTKMKEEVTALKARIVSMERTQSSVVRAAVKTTTDELLLEREHAVEEERARADQLEEQRSVAQLQNELLTEMVAAEQVNVKLHERRNEALKWELLRQGGCQEKFDSIAQEVPILADTLRADTTDVVHGLAKHDMAEAVEHVVCGIADIKVDLEQAFLARDTGRTGALGGSAFKDALKESFPDMPREDRQLLMLRFVREVDQSVDYKEFLDFCSHKAQSRERLKMGLTGALAATRFGGRLSKSPARGATRFASTLPAQGAQGERVKPFFATALTLSRPEPLTSTKSSTFDDYEAGGRRGTGRTDSVFTQGTVDPVTETAVNAKVAALVALRGAELETLLQARDPDRSGEVRVKGFSECLRAWDSGESVRRRSSEGGAGGDSSQGEGKPGGEKHGDVGALTHADRKVLYKRWAVKGYVNYDEFLRASGHHAAPPARFSGASTAALAAATAARLHSFGKRGKRPSRGARGAASEANREDDQEEKALLARARVVLVHLSEVLQDEGEESYFAAFEDQDVDNRRRLDEDGFIDAMGVLAPEVTAEQVLGVFRVRSRVEGDEMMDYDKLFQDLRILGGDKGFQHGDAIELRVKKRGGGIDWVPAQVISKDEDGTYTVRFRSIKVPGGIGARIKESGIRACDMREVVSLEPPKKEAKMGAFMSAIVLWVAARSKKTKSKPSAAPPSLLSRLFGQGDANSKTTLGKRKTKRKGKSRSPSRKRTSGRRRREDVESESRLERSVERHYSDSDSSSSSSSSSRSSRSSRSSDYATEPERTPRRQSPPSRSSSHQHSHRSRHHQRGGTNPSTPRSAGSGSAGGGGFWSSDDEKREGGGTAPRSPTSARRSATSRPPSPSPSPSPARRRSERGGSAGTRRVVELPVIREGASLPAAKGSTDPRQESSRSKRAPVSEGTKRSSGKGERRNSGGLKSLETLERSNIEDKFDLYKKRTKNALSPDKRGSGTAKGSGRGAGRTTSASASTGRRESSAAAATSLLSH